ncbi:copper chaperone PCu(A)C [Salipiger mangrovisoli]|uniref:Copper chaperone PCu(A)C n=1 Tax=Salipiger mangrovisoli TaxID=2865933 RepID=A0ABR9X8J8_9RHOB|nr:copper chaperone PCu(A)C [Salipiger mangrovisoli]MBE9639891.1 copper chaperone PCu(A)C [Salipiger mangrovisoli]
MGLKFALMIALGLSTAAQVHADIVIEDAYARAAMPSAASAAVYMQVRNDGPEDDRLIAASSESAAKTMLHGSSEGANGVVSMQGHAEGVLIPAGSDHAFARGGDHIMLMGLTRPMEQGATVGLVLTFERAGEIRLEVPVDLDR